MQQTSSIAQATTDVDQTEEEKDTKTENHPIVATVQEININSLYINETPFFDRPNDPRPYAKLIANQCKNNWFIDTGAVVCVIACTDLDEILLLYGTTIRPTNIVINTVHTMRTPATGIIDLTYEFGLQIRVIPTLLIKARKPQFIAGMSFFHAFDVALEVEPGFYSKHPNQFQSRDILSTNVTIASNQKNTCDKPERVITIDRNGSKRPKRKESLSRSKQVRV